MIFKVCGMKYEDNIVDLQRVEPDWMGMIFYDKSPRNLSEVPDLSEVGAKKIGVFVDAEKAFVIRKIKTYGLDGIQLHGEEEPAFCQEFFGRQLIVIKAFAVGREFDFAVTEKYEGVCDYFLFDTKGSAPGGTGKSFNWDLLKDYHGDTPFILSGGIGPESVESLKDFDHPKWAGIDINSRFEIDPGIKNIDLIQRFKYELLG